MTPEPFLMDEASRRQVQAADPARSTWLEANAGSGKTRVLTDRVARLLLAGTRPERILCLTYTKAAASEMQNRLLQRLGAWAMLPEADLRNELAKLGEGGDWDAPSGPLPDLAAARRLFARAIETPGGLKVQTIHSFCGALLRRFPLEAGVPHQFTELDDRTAARTRAEIMDQMAQERGPEIDALLEIVRSESDIERLLSDIVSQSAALTRPMDEGALDLPDRSADEVVAEVFKDFDSVFWQRLQGVAASGSTNDIKVAQKLALGDWDDPGMAEFDILTRVVLFGEKTKTPFGPKPGFLTKKSQEALNEPERLDHLAHAVAEARPLVIALRYRDRWRAVDRFAKAFLARYQRVKDEQGWLDFDDLIARAKALLSDAAVAQWVLFRLDGGIDHILVDEAQDTSPTQWAVIAQLAAEFTAGVGAGDRPRSLFVVGDPKQSIYSFQGADAAELRRRHQGFAAGFQAAGQPMQESALLHSFRSSPAILRVVDAVFADEQASLGGESRHLAFHDTLPGRVDLWPLVTPPEKDAEAEGDEADDWRRPVDSPAPDDPKITLAKGVAARIREMIDTRTLIRHRGRVRPVTAGDVLILVRRRSGVFSDLIRECKAAGLPVAGADRLKLAAEMAVRDIRSLLSFLSTPEDDLSLAEALRSPLFGLDEDALYRLAAGRKGYLWAALRQSADHTPILTPVREVLEDLRDHTDFLRPYDLISRMLVRHDGRARLLARLGPEAEDGIEELLSQALAYEQNEPPSLTGFLVWLGAGDVEVKRAAGTGDMIRVMTVHGAKGLEAPVVIVPEMSVGKGADRAFFVATPDGVAASAPSGQRPEMVTQWLDEAEARLQDEQKRLLYVALTRAESWLILGGVAGARAMSPDWYEMVRAGLSRLGAEPLDTPFGEGLRYAFGDWPEAAGRGEDGADDAPAAPADPVWPAPSPDWAMPAPTPPARMPTVAATDLGGAKVVVTQATGQGAGGADGVADDVSGPQFGTWLHLLLEHVADLPKEDWPKAARDVWAGSEPGLPPAQVQTALLADLAALIEAPDLAAVFDPQGEVLREVALSIPWKGGVLHGVIDRLHLTPDEVTAIDYKTNAIAPDRAEDIPEGILRQMAAYAYGLGRIYPDRRVKVAILWTRRRQMMEVPPHLLTPFFDGDAGVSGQGGG